MAITIDRAKIGVVMLGLVGVVLLVIGVVALSVLPSIFKAKVQENLALAEGKEAFEKWKKTPIPVTFSVYMFNITNPKEVAQFGNKPIVKEVGPFVFQQLRSKDILNWDPKELTVTYKDIKRYYFVPSLSANITEKIYSLNLPLQGVLMFIKNFSDWIQSAIIGPLQTILETYKEELILHKTPKELLFDGYKVDLIEDLLGIIDPFTDVPQILPNNTFGYLYDKNNSGDGIFTVYTGQDDIRKYSQIVRWNNMERIPFWNDHYCDMMNGTDGAQFPPPITKKDILYVYTPDLCRSVFLEYERDVVVRGIPAYRFVTPERLFASPKQNPDNQCYCTEAQYCDLSGILDVSPCRKGLKLAVTAPHFYQSHPFVKDSIEGLHPNKDAHVTYLDIEPTTGLVLRASRKLQMNFILNQFQGLRQTQDAPNCVMPLIWVKEEAEIDDNVAALFTAKVRTPVTIAKSVLTACIVLGVLWIVTAGFVTVYILMKQQKAARKVLKGKYTPVPQKSEMKTKNEKSATVNA